MIYKNSPLRRIYLKMGQLLSGTAPDNWRHNLTIANSKWSAQVMREVYGVESYTVYPPVVDGFDDIPWDNREQGFVCISRVVPEKRIERVIDIVGKVRRRGWDVHLHVIGELLNTAYSKNVRRLAEQHGEWVFLEGSKCGKKKTELLSRHRFGMSGRRHEPFGISIAEMVKAGCIVWVPDSGGQVEIVNHPQLVFNSDEDAVDKIDRVLKESRLREALQVHLAGQSQKFSASRFMSEIKDLTKTFLKDNGSTRH